MELSKIESTVNRVIQENFGISEKYFTKDSNIITDLGGDSLDLVELFMVLEDEFKIEIQYETSISCTTVQDIINLVSSIMTKTSK